MIEEEISKNTVLYQMVTKDAESIGSKLLVYSCTYGPPLRIRSDNESGLTSEALVNLKQQLGIELLKTTTAYSPEHNGLIEIFGQSFGIAIRKVAKRDQTNWVKILPDC